MATMDKLDVAARSDGRRAAHTFGSYDPTFPFVRVIVLVPPPRMDQALFAAATRSLP
jgi:hypothetical protein